MNRIGFIIFGDFVAFWASLLILLFVRFGVEYNSAISAHIIPFTILYLAWTLSFFLFGLYDLLNIKPTIHHLNRFGTALFASFITGIFFFYFIPSFGIAPKTNLLFQVMGFGIISILLR
jgi:FlaA1/EpsC-like NDP-sugar epimerase